MKVDGWPADVADYVVVFGVLIIEQKFVRTDLSILSDNVKQLEDASVKRDG